MMRFSVVKLSVFLKVAEFFLYVAVLGECCLKEGPNLDYTDTYG